MLELTIGKASEAGIKKKESGKENEDTLWVDTMPEGGVFIVADGLGGHALGKEASNAATSYVGGALGTKRYSDLDDQQLISALIGVIKKANVFGYAGNVDSEEGDQNKTEKRHYKATTITAAIVKDDKIFVAYVGNSRVHVLYNSGDMKKNPLREKDSPLEYSLEKKLGNETITEDEMIERRLMSPGRNVTNAIGINEDVDIGVEIYDISNVRYLLLSTDGLTNNVTDNEIKEVLTEYHDPQKAADRLMELGNNPIRVQEVADRLLDGELSGEYENAIRNGVAGHDDITVLAIKFGGK